MNDYKDGTLKSIMMALGVLASIYIGILIYFVN